MNAKEIAHVMVGLYRTYETEEEVVNKVLEQYPLLSTNMIHAMYHAIDAHHKSILTAIICNQNMNNK
jgi:hypothetical protein